MWTRRIFLKKWFLGSLIFSFFGRFFSSSWAQAKKLLPKGLPKDQIIEMNPADIDNRELEIDPLDEFGTMGPTDIKMDLETYRLNIKGKVGNHLSLSFDQIQRFPSISKVVLLICPGFFANNGHWTGVSLKTLLTESQVETGAQFVEIRAEEKVVKIPLEELKLKKVLLAYRVNGQPLPQKHGFPIRLVLEDHYGNEWVKYVNEIVVS
jgi:DMSO/TMAO reductase YedYZ molybdopterin-dependent catalytic subunit